MEKDGNGFIKMDPAVEAVINSGTKLREDRSMPRAERAKAKKKAARQADRNGKRGNYDLNTFLISEMKRLADEYGTTASQVVGIGLYLLLEAIKSGEVDLGEYRRRLERNPRYEYELVWPLESGESRTENRESSKT